MKLYEDKSKFSPSKISILCAFLVLFLTTSFSFFPLVKAASEKKIIYTVYWRGCEELCQGFQDYIGEKNINADIIIRDAMQDKSKISSFREEARAMKADLILTWGTSVTLGMAGTIDEVNNPQFNNHIPHVFTGVADPVRSRIVESLDNSGRPNMTGTFNRVPESVNISTIRSYMPTFKRLGLIYNPNERNSVQKFEEMVSVAKQMNFKLVALKLNLNDNGLPNEQDIPAKIKVLKENHVDFIYLGSSSFLDTHRNTFTGAAVASGIPVLSPYERLVRDSHALLSIAARYYDLGRLVGEQAEKILINEVVPGELPIARMTDFAYVINMEVARKLNLFPSVEILQIAETVK